MAIAGIGATHNPGGLLRIQQEPPVLLRKPEAPKPAQQPAPPPPLVEERVQHRQQAAAASVPPAPTARPSGPVTGTGHPTQRQVTEPGGPNLSNVLAWGSTATAAPGGPDALQAAAPVAPSAATAPQRRGPRDDPKYQFKQEAIRTIHGNDSHPLRGLLALDSNGQARQAFLKPSSRHHYNLLGRSETLGEPLTPAARDGRPFYVEAGHGTSRFSGEPEFLGLQDAHGNQVQGKHEAKGVIITRRFVDIDGVPVEKQTALQWEREIDPRTGRPLLQPGTTARSPSSKGWPVNPVPDDVARPATSPALRSVSIAGRVLKPVAVVSDGLRMKEAYEADGGKVGEQTIKTAGSVAGGWAGAAAGAQVGAEVGAAVGVWCGGVGAAPGAVIGGVVGGIAGGLGGSWLGSALA